MIQLFKDIKFSTSTQPSEVELLYPHLLKLLSYEYCRYLSQKKNSYYFFNSKYYFFSIYLYNLFKSSFLYYNTFKINNINIYTDLNLYIKVSISLIIISTYGIRSLLFCNPQKNSYNLTNCIKQRKSWMK